MILLNLKVDILYNLELNLIIVTNYLKDVGNMFTMTPSKAVEQMLPMDT